MLRVIRRWQKGGKTGVSVDALLRELLGGEGRAMYACEGDPRSGRVDIHMMRGGGHTFQYQVEDTAPSEDLCFVVDVIAAINGRSESRGAWPLALKAWRRQFFLSALDLKSRVSVKDLVATYDLMAETGQPLSALVGELGLT